MSEESFPISRNELPALYQAASKEARNAKRHTTVATVLSLSMIVLGSLTGVFTLLAGTSRLAGAIASLAFFVAIIIQTERLVTKPDAVWYEARTLTESAKSLAWRYMVGGEPFSLSLTKQNAEALLSGRLQGILGEVKAVSLDPLKTEDAQQITPAMQSLRAGSFEERKRAYQAGRLQTELKWYESQARWHKQRAQMWGIFLILLEVLAAIVAVLQALNLLGIDLLGMITTLISVGVSWLQFQQHATLAQSYSIAAHELALFNESLPNQQREEDWARFVGETENAISREHALWHAKHTEHKEPVVEL